MGASVVAGEEEADDNNDDDDTGGAPEPDSPVTGTPMVGLAAMFVGAAAMCAGVVLVALIVTRRRTDDDVDSESSDVEKAKSLSPSVTSSTPDSSSDGGYLSSIASGSEASLSSAAYEVYAYSASYGYGSSTESV